jgi:hypothetical protein
VPKRSSGLFDPEIKEDSNGSDDNDAKKRAKPGILGKFRKKKEDEEISEGSIGTPMNVSHEGHIGFDHKEGTFTVCYPHFNC